MIKPSPRELALILLHRSRCRVQVAAVIWDKKGIFSWGWNHLNNDAKGTHAEAHAIARANRERLYGARITIAAKRRKNQAQILAKPCENCMELLKSFDLIEYTTKTEWVEDWYEF
jgi:pyrimidine deaminase RibD-like protein